VTLRLRAGTTPCLTLTNPWAMFVAWGLKLIETRDWWTSYRGPLAIHAAKTWPRWAQQLVYDDPAYRDAMLAHGVVGLKHLPHGAVVATCRLVACVPTDELAGSAWGHRLTPQERAFGDYSPGRWAWVLADVVALPEPAPAAGALYLWRWVPEQEPPTEEDP